jgi:hypothetical protein
LSGVVSDATLSVESILNYFRGEPSHVANTDALKIAAESLTASCSFRYVGPAMSQPIGILR